MIKRVFLFAAIGVLLIVFIGVLTNAFGALNVTVIKTKALTAQEEGEFCFPKMNKIGTKVFFSNPNYMGLYVYDLNRNSLLKLNDDLGSGNNYSINSDGTEGIYRTYNLINGRRFFSLIKQNFENNDKVILEKSIRNLSPAMYADDQTIVYSVNKNLKKSRLGSSLNKKIDSDIPFVSIEDRKIVLFMGEQKTFLEPRGAGSYIWPELSPDGKKILFKKLGDGCYISDLEGNIISSIGDINAPHWSPDGNWIVYMDDKDDGYKLISSEIHIINVESKKDYKLTDTIDRIEIYPQWGPDKNSIVFSSARGQIFLMHLKWD